MHKITVFTPTYNRAYCLGNCYNSLKNQTNKNFIWLIVDDGSSDNTKELVKSWIKEGFIEINYYKQANGGMHSAHNRAYEIINTELNVCIDSDDYMPKDAVDKILSFWGKYGNDKVSGIIGLDSYISGEIIGTKLPNNIQSSTLIDLHQKYKVKGDKKIVYRTELTKKFPYPVFGNEKYVGLAYKYYKLDQSFKLLILNEILCCVEYLEDGSSKNMLKQYLANPKGFSFYRLELMKLQNVGKLFKYKQAIHYFSSSLIAKDKKFFKKTPYKILTILASPFGIMLYAYIILNNYLLEREEQ